MALRYLTSHVTLTPFQGQKVKGQGHRAALVPVQVTT